jgi:hypothetical protein
MAGNGYGRDLGRCQQLSGGPLVDFNQADIAGPSGLSRNPQVTRIAPRPLSSFGPGFPLAPFRKTR